MLVRLASRMAWQNSGIAAASSHVAGSLLRGSPVNSGMGEAIAGQNVATSVAWTAASLGGVRFATKVGGGSTKNKKDSAGRRLGVKKFGKEKVIPGNIIVRQRGTKFHPGLNVGMGRDHTLFSKAVGEVKFYKLFRPGRRNRWRQYVNVIPVGDDGKQLEQHYQIIDQEYLTRFKEKNKGIRRETVPQMLRRRAKAELIARGLPPKLEGDWKAILKEPSQVLETIPEGIEQQASV